MVPSQVKFWSGTSLNSLVSLAVEAPPLEIFVATVLSASSWINPLSQPSATVNEWEDRLCALQCVLRYVRTFERNCQRYRDEAATAKYELMCHVQLVTLWLNRNS